MKLEDIGSRLAQCAEQEDFDEVLRLLPQYREEFDRTWGLMPVEEQRVSDMPARAAALLSSVWERAVRSRNVKVGRLRALKLTSRYRQESSAHGAWQTSV